MKPFRFGLRTLFIFTAACALFASTARIPHRPRFMLVNYGNTFPTHCVTQPWEIHYGWPFAVRTDTITLHPKHKAGECPRDAEYHVTSLLLNFTIYASLAVVLLVLTPYVIARQIRLGRERKMIDSLTS